MFLFVFSEQLKNGSLPKKIQSGFGLGFRGVGYTTVCFRVGPSLELLPCGFNLFVCPGLVPSVVVTD